MKPQSKNLIQIHTGFGEPRWRRPLAVALLVLGASSVGSWVLGPDGFHHYHETERERRAHSHVHGGPHRHDHYARKAHENASPLSPHGPASPANPRPERDGDAPEGRYVPAVGTVVGQPAAVAHFGMSFDATGPLSPTTTSPPRFARVDTAIPPRGPPA